MHPRVAEMVRHCATLGNHTHLIIWSRWKLAAGGDHDFGVLLGELCVLFVVSCMK